MKTFLRLLLFLSPIFVKAQITPPILRANFGVDGDVKANYINGFNQNGNDDWFPNPSIASVCNPGCNGQFVIDTTGAAAIVAGYISSPATRLNSFWRGMSRPTYSIVNNRLWLDAIYVRDYHAPDTTVFVVASKNGESPAIWTGGVQSIPQKNDILDAFMHIRRAGPIATDSLWMFGGLSVDFPDADRFYDFEMFQTDLYYDRVSQKFYGYGPDAGHTSWQFDAAGNVIKPGDACFAYTYKGATSPAVYSLETRIWVSYADWTTVTPTNFSWGGAFDGDGAGALYGYASIVPATAGSYFMGLLNSSSIENGGPFQVINGDNSLSPTYAKQQFMEFAVNLTKLGLDPVTTAGTDVCGSPFNRLVVKTRASESFTSSLKDFVAPTDLFLAPRAIAAADVPLFCGTIGVSTIQVQNPSGSSVYTWTTPDGHIVGTTAGTSITVDAPGSYIVTQRLSAVCNPYAYDTVTVTYDPNCVPLDNNILSFKGALNNSITKLDWSVAQNRDVSYFEIERSFNGRDFNFVSHIDADSDKDLLDSYTAYDDLSHLPVETAVFYRLKLKKANGGTSYSKIIRIPYGSLITRISIAPNPVHDMMQVTINKNRKDLVNLYMYDMSGKLVRRLETDLQAGTNVISLDNLSTLQRGMYLVVVHTGEEIFRQKVVLEQ